MKKDSISYEIGVLMAMSYKENNQSLYECANSLLASLDDDEIIDIFLLEGIKNEISDSKDEEKVTLITNNILEDYGLNLFMEE